MRSSKVNEIRRLLAAGAAFSLGLSCISSAQTPAYTNVTQTWTAPQTFSGGSSTTPPVIVNGGITQNATTTWSGSSQGSPTLSPLWMQQTLNGTSTAPHGHYLWANQIGMNDQFNAGNKDTMLDTLNIQDSLITSTPAGSRNVLHSNIIVTATPSDTGNQGSNFPAYVAEFPEARVSANLGGSGTTYATSAGSLFGVNPNVTAASGATNLYGMVGEEIDVTAETGSSLAQKFGLTIVQGDRSTVQGTQDDAAMVIMNQQNAVAWRFGMSFGENAAFWPFNSNSTLIYGTPGQSGYGNAPAGMGIDWGNVSFSTAAVKLPGLTIDPYGRSLTAGTGVISASTPTLSSCGSGPAITGSDQAGTVTLGSGGPTSCVINFAHAWPSVPHCVLTARATATPGALAIIGDSLSSITVQAVNMPSFNYVCMA